MSFKYLGKGEDLTADEVKKKLNDVLCVTIVNKNASIDGIKKSLLELKEIIQKYLVRIYCFYVDIDSINSDLVLANNSDDVLKIKDDIISDFSNLKLILSKYGIKSKGI